MHMYLFSSQVKFQLIFFQHSIYDYKEAGFSIATTPEDGVTHSLIQHDIMSWNKFACTHKFDHFFLT